MLLWAAVVVAVAILLWYLKLEVTLEKSFTVLSTVSRKDIFIFLSTPVNLERSHPTIYKVSDIRTENASMTFNIEDNLGRLLGTKRLSMKMSISSESSKSTSHIRLDCYSSVANVSVTLSFSDFYLKTPTCQAIKNASDDLSSTIHVLVAVSTWRMFSHYTCAHVLGVWDETIKKTIDILGGKLDLVSHGKINQP